MNSQAFTAEAQRTQRKKRRGKPILKFSFSAALCVLCASAVKGSRIHTLRHKAAR
jgi:hypothetical protein